MNIDLTYPTTWEEITADHLMIMGNLFVKQKTREELLFDLFCSLTGIKPLIKHGIDEDTPVAVYFFKKNNIQFSMEISVIAKACEELSFLIDSIGLPECPIVGFNRKLYGVSFRNYYFADAYFIKYSATSDIRYLKLYFQTLFNKRLKRHLITPVAIWWGGLKQYLRQQYPEVLQEGNDESNRTPADMLQDLLSVLNKNSPERNEAILDSDCHSVLISLNNIYQYAKNDKPKLS